MHNKDFCLKWHFKNHKRGKHKFELGTRSEPKTGKRGKISRKGGSDQIPLFYDCSPNFFCMPKSSRGAKTCFTKVGSWYLIILSNYTCFYKSGKLISKHFEQLYMFSFWGNSKNRCRGGEVPLIPLHFVTKC